MQHASEPGQPLRQPGERAVRLLRVLLRLGLAERAAGRHARTDVPRYVDFFSRGFCLVWVRVGEGGMR